MYIFLFPKECLSFLDLPVTRLKPRMPLVVNQPRQTLQSSLVFSICQNASLMIQQTFWKNRESLELPP